MFLGVQKGTLNKKYYYYCVTIIIILIPPQESNPFASLVFYWEPLNRQVSVLHRLFCDSFWVDLINFDSMFRFGLRAGLSDFLSTCPLSISTPDQRAARLGLR